MTNKTSCSLSCYTLNVTGVDITVNSTTAATQMASFSAAMAVVSAVTSSTADVALTLATSALDDYKCGSKRMTHTLDGGSTNGFN